MATNGQDAPGGRLLLLTALLALAVTAAVGFARVFQGHGTQFKLALAAGVAVLLAGALERRHVLVSVPVSLAGLVVAVGLVVFPQTTSYGLPSLSTLRAAVDAMGQVGRTAAVQIAPAIPLPSLVLAGLVAVWSAGFAAHSLAARARSPLLAVVPPASLLAFANIVVEDGVRPLYVLSFLAAALTVLFGDAIHRVAQWGPISAWRPPFERPRQGLGALFHSPLRLRGSTTARSARRVATATLAAAALGAWLLPGFRSPGILTFEGEANPLHVSIDPIVDIKPALLDTKAIPLFDVRSTRAAYWRFLSLDTFDGQRWLSSNLQATGGPILASGPLGTGREVDVAATEAVSTIVSQHVAINKLGQPWLPVAYDPVGISVRGSAIRYDPVSDILFSPDGTYPGFTYDVISRQVVPTPQQLDEAALPPAATVRPYVQLPSGTPRQIFQIARRLTDKQSTVYRKALAIQDYLRDNFRYDLRVPAGHDANHILTFLTDTKAGYCEQFAGSMAVLLRALGIPARVAVGFTPGRLKLDTGVWEVTLQNAHAWVEVLFPKYGWLAFEPTPTRSNPVATPYTDPNLAPFGGCTQQAECVTPGQGENDPGVPDSPHGSQVDRLTNPLFEQVPNQPLSGIEAPPIRRTGSWRWPAAWALLALVALALLAVPGSKVLSRRLTLARAHEPRERVLAAFEVMTLRASDLGLGRRPHETLLEYRTRLQRRVSSLDGDLDRLTTLAAEAAYSGTDPSEGDADFAVASAGRVAGDIRRSTGTARRVAGWFRLRGSPNIR